MASRWRTVTVAFSLVLALTAASGTPGVPAGLAATTTTRPPAAVGALFTLTAGGRLGTHFCTGTVVDSPSGDLVLTAAHCLTGRRVGSYAFVPAYHRGSAPFGIWLVGRAFVDSAWARSGSVDDDFAFLEVARPAATTSLQSLTGAIGLRTASAPGKQATVVGYPAASESAILCRNVLLAYTATQLEFDCGGYTNGTSGSALVVDADPASGLGVAVGVIGGFEQGGDTPAVSYAARFGDNVKALYDTARRAAGTRSS